MGRRAAALSSIVLVAVLGALMISVLVGVSGLSRRTGEVRDAVRALSAYQDVQRALAAEAFAEAGYRRAPSADSRQRAEEAVAGLSASVDEVKQLGSTRDDGVISYLLVLNRRYEGELRAALRVGSTSPATSADDRVAGPALDAMQHLVDAAVLRQQRRADTALAGQAALTRTMWVLGPAALAVAALAITLCWSVIFGQYRRLRGRAEISEHRALHDVLTGVGNRALLANALCDELSRRVPDAVLIMVDLDHFKLINDRHGHLAGDEVLRVVAQRLVEVAGRTDVVCRMGGDEFAVLVRPAADGRGRAAQVKRALTGTVSAEGVSLQTGGSVGLVALRAGMTQSDLLREVDESLYAAKRVRRVPDQRHPLAGVRPA